MLGLDYYSVQYTVLSCLHVAITKTVCIALRERLLELREAELSSSSEKVVTIGLVRALFVFLFNVAGFRGLG